MFAYIISIQEYLKMSEETNNRIILGLDVSTACIGVSVVEDNGTDKPTILSLKHETPKVSRNIKGMEALFLRKKIFETECLKDIASKYKITDVVIEEPLLSSNNVNTVATLLRFNGMISDSIYNIFGLVPNFISSYDARMFSFPDLVSIRKYNKKGVEYPLKHIENAIKKGNIVLFGSYPFDIDKKTVMMNKVNEMYNENEISWTLNDKGELKKENFDACDSLICAIAYININHNGIDKTKITEHSISEDGNEIIVSYKTQIWDRVYDKKVILKKT